MQRHPRVTALASAAGLFLSGAHCAGSCSEDCSCAIGADCNSDCACPTRRAVAAPGPTPPMLQRHPNLHVQPLDDGHVVACVPSFSQVAVLDRAALGLLESFARPRPWRERPPAEAEAAEHAYRLGLLSADGAIPAPPPGDTLVAWLHVTNACNLRCTYCYVEKSDEAMDLATARASVDGTLRSALAHGYERVTLKYAGGEASLNMPLVAAAHQYAADRCAELGLALRGGVLSNGTALTTARLRQIRALGLDLMISLDGDAAYNDRQRPLVNGRGSWAAATAGIERTRALGLDPTISVTVSGQSAPGLPDLVAWLLDRELRFTLNFYRPTGPGCGPAELRLDEERLIAGMRAAYAVIAGRPPAYSLLGSLLDRADLGAPHARTCGVGESYLVVDQAGRVAKCQMELGAAVTTVAAADPLGLIRADQIGVQNLSVERKEPCRSCTWRYWCAGGCAVATYHATGHYDVRSPNCAIYQALFPEVVRLEGRRLLFHHLAHQGAPALV